MTQETWNRAFQTALDRQTLLANKRADPTVTVTITLDRALRIIDAQSMAIKHLSCATAEEAHARSCLCDVNSAMEDVVNAAMEASK
jgi:hypothetical protein